MIESTLDIQGRFALSVDFMTKELCLKVRLTDPRTQKTYEATVPFHEVEIKPLRYSEGG